MRFHLYSFQLVVEFISVPYRQSLFPVPGMRIERVAEVMMSLVRFWVRRYRRSQKRETEHIAHAIVTVFRLVDEAKPVAIITEIGPAERRNFKACLFPTVIPTRSADRRV